MVSQGTRREISKLFSLLVNFETYWNGIRKDLKEKKFNAKNIFIKIAGKTDLLSVKQLEDYCRKMNILGYNSQNCKFFLFLFDPLGSGISSLLLPPPFSPLSSLLLLPLPSFSSLFPPSPPSSLFLSFSFY